MKNKLFIGAALGCSLLASSTTVYALSSETEALLKLLEEKKVITQKDAESFRQTIEEDMAAGEEAGADDSLLQKINERVTLSGTVELEAAASEDFAGNDANAATVQLAVVF